jgi:restriction system protein
MAQSGGGRSEWQRRQAAAQRAEKEAAAARQASQREADRRARQVDKEDRERRLAERQRAAEEETARLAACVAELDRDLLLGALERPSFSVRALEIEPDRPVFRPGALAVAGIAPDWAAYEPPPPSMAGRLVGGASRYRRELEAAQSLWERDTARFQQDEADRRRELESHRSEHERRVAAAEERAAAHNANLATRWTACIEGDPEAVEWFVGEALAASIYPEGFPHARKIAYRSSNRDIVVEIEFPRRSVIPEVKEYRFYKSSGETKTVERREPEARKLYARLVAWTALRVLHEVFAATNDLDLVDAVVLNGTVTDVDPATGKDTLYHLVSLEPERSIFEESLDLARVTDPIRCLKGLGARVSPNPYDLDAIEPVVTFDLRRFRLANDSAELADLDSRPNLLQLSPYDFEVWIEELFRAMGVKSYRTIKSKDDGIDVVVTSDDLIFGGICLVQAKRTKNVVDLGTVHALAGTMADHNAAKGIVVTTSWFGQASKEFARRNRITPIPGEELKHLFQRYLGREVIPGTTPPRRGKAAGSTYRESL